MLPIKINLVFGFNNFTHTQICLPSTNYRGSVGEVKKGSHHRGESLGYIQYVKDLFIKHGKMRTYEDILQECIKNGTTGYLTLPNITWLLCLYDTTYNGYNTNIQFMKDQLNNYYLGKGSHKIAKEIQMFREMVIEVLKLETEAGNFCIASYQSLIKMNWKTQNVVDFYMYNNDKNSFQKVVNL